MSTSEPRSLTILALGRVPLENFSSLSGGFEVEQVEVAIPPDPAALNKAIVTAAHSWILLLREREVVPDALARELSGVMTESASAWAFRIRTDLFYAGRPLRLGATGDGEIRLFHRRHARFDVRSDADTLKVEGTVVRLQVSLQQITFASASEHIASHSHDARVGLPRQVAAFVRSLVRARTLDGNTLRYLWIEAGYAPEKREGTRGR